MDLNKQRMLGFLHRCSISFPVDGVILWAIMRSFYISLALTSFPGGSEGKASACNAGDLGSIPGSGRSPGGGNGNPLQYSCRENPMDRGAWWATVHRIPKSWTQLKRCSMHPWEKSDSSDHFPNICSQIIPLVLMW